MPESTEASTSLTTRTSTNRSRSPGIVRAGAALRTRRVCPLLATRNASSTASSGTSSWATSRSAPSIRDAAARTIAGVHALLAPGVTTIVFSPRASSVIAASPVGSVRVHVQAGQVDAGRGDGARRGPPIVIVSNRADERRRGPEARQRDRLVRPLAADRPARAAPEHRLAARRQLVDVEEQVDVDAADNECTHGTR